MQTAPLALLRAGALGNNANALRGRIELRSKPRIEQSLR